MSAVLRDPTGAERARRYRERQKCGIRVVPVELDIDTLENLIARGRLDAECATDERLLAESLALLLESL